MSIVTKKIAGAYIEGPDNNPDLSKDWEDALFPELREDALLQMYFGQTNVNGIGKHLVRDHVGGNHGTIIGEGWKITYDAVDDLGTVTDHSSIQNIFDGWGTVGVICNPKSDGQNSRGRILDKFAGGGWLIHLMFESNGFAKTRFIQDFSTTNGQWDSINAIVPLNIHSTIEVSYNADSVAYNPIFRINGVEYTIGSGMIESATPVGTRDTDVGNDLIIGNQHGGSSGFDGDIYKAFLHNAQRTLSDHDQLYKQGTFASTPVALYECNEATGNCVNSGTGGAGVITLTGAIHAQGRISHSFQQEAEFGSNVVVNSGMRSDLDLDGVDDYLQFLTYNTHLSTLYGLYSKFKLDAVAGVEAPIFGTFTNGSKGGIEPDGDIAFFSQQISPSLTENLTWTVSTDGIPNVVGDGLVHELWFNVDKNENYVELFIDSISYGKKNPTITEDHSSSAINRIGHDFSRYFDGLMQKAAIKDGSVWDGTELAGTINSTDCWLYYDIFTDEILGSDIGTNGNCELDSGFIDHDTPSTRERSSEQAHGGTYSQKFISTGSTRGLETPEFAVSDGRNYRITYWIYSTDRNSHNIRLRNGDGTTLSTEVWQNQGQTINQWNLQTWDFTPTVTGSNARIIITDPSQTMTAYIDDILIQEGEIRDTSGNNRHAKRIGGTWVHADWVADAGVTLENGQAEFDGTAGNVDLTAAVDPLFIGKTYRHTFVVSGYVSGDVKLHDGAEIGTVSANGTNSVVSKATSESLAIRGATFVGNVDSLISEVLNEPFLGDGIQKGIVLDGVARHIVIPHSANLTFGDGITDSPFSVIFAAKTDDISLFYPFIKRSPYGTDREFSLVFSNSDLMTVQLFDDDSTNYIGRTYSVAQTALENTVITGGFTYDGGGVSTGLKLYLNGSRVDDTNQNLGSYTAMHNHNLPIYIGASLSAPIFSKGTFSFGEFHNVEKDVAFFAKFHNWVKSRGLST